MGITKYNINDLKEKAVSLKGFCLSTQYTNNIAKYEWQCDRSHKWNATWGSILNQETWCPQCSKEDKIQGRKKYNIVDLHTHAFQKEGKCLSDRYLAIDDKYQWSCKEGHKWNATWGSVIDGRWCKTCGHKKKGIAFVKYTIEDLKKIALDKGGDCLSTVYTNDKAKYTWINHNNGNIWEAQWCSVLNGTWCPIDGRKKANDSLLVKDGLELLNNWALKKEGECLSSVYLGQMKDHIWKCKKGHIWEASFNNVKNHDSWCPHCTTTISKPHQEIIDFIKTVYAGEILINNRQAIKPLELDIYIPEFKLGIEFDGLYWHSDAISNNSKKKNIEKIKLTKEKDISLFSIFEDEWNNPTKQDLIKEMIKYRLKIAPKIKLRASKLELRKLTNNKEFKEFFSKFHLDGHASASFAYGLFYNNELVSCMSFRKSFTDKCWEIARFANDYNYLIHGNAGKLIKEFKHEFDGKLITFSNNRLSKGNVYQQLGFKEITKTIDPSYYYTDFTTRIWRFKCKRINEPEIIAKFPTEKEQALGGVFSEKYLGHNKPLYKIYDYGHKKWELMKE